MKNYLRFGIKTILYLKAFRFVRNFPSLSEISCKWKVNVRFLFFICKQKWRNVAVKEHQ